MNLWTRGLGDEDIDRLIEANGNLPGELMSYVFAQMTPGATLSKYNIGLLDTFDDEKKLLNFLRMEKWIADRPHHPGEAAKQLLINLYKNNELIRGEFQLGGRTVKLSDIQAPILNIFAKDDHIIPPKTTQALRSAVGTTDYSEIGLNGGHVGVFVSGKSQGILGKGIHDWLQERD
jgi:polyhydroxyalkanoate synthase